MSKKKPDHFTKEDFNTILPQILFDFSQYLGNDTKQSYTHLENYFKHLNKKDETKSVQLGQDDQTQP